MRFALTETQASVRELARKILVQEVSEPSLKELEKTGGHVHAKAWGALARAGLLGVAVSEADEGMGGGVIELALLLEEIGRTVAPVPALGCLAYGALALSRYGTAEQRSRLLPGVLEGSSFVTGAPMEHGVRGGMQSRARAVRIVNGFEVTGAFHGVPVADLATRIVVAANGGLLLVDPKLPGVSLTRNVATHGEPQFRLELARVVISDADVLVVPGTHSSAVAWYLQAATVCTSAVALGVAARAVEITAKYTSERKQFGVPIATFQAVRQRAADAFIDVEALRVAVYQAAWQLDAGRDATVATAVAKLHACDAGYRATYAAQHLHGGIGYDTDYVIHRYYLWARALELTLGTAPDQLALIGALIAERTLHVGE